MTAPNLNLCPNCGRENFPVASVETVEGLAAIYIEGEAGRFTARWQGVGEADWDLSVTRYYLCRACGRSLPEDYAAALDALLDNTREPTP